MSKKKPEKDHELAQVLERINSLTKHGKQTSRHVTAKDTAAEIPLLTEVYEGQPVTFGAFEPLASDTTDQSGMQIEWIGSSQATATQLAETEAIEKLLIEMQPIIQATVKEAVQRELAHMEQTLHKKLEAELTQIVRKYLQSNLP